MKNVSGQGFQRGNVTGSVQLAAASTSAQILEAALRTIAERGYSATSVAELAENRKPESLRH
ncbi:TetR family transcriptional regulator [Nocardia sp. NPDC004278]